MPFLFQVLTLLDLHDRVKSHVLGTSSLFDATFQTLCVKTRVLHHLCRARDDLFQRLWPTPILCQLTYTLHARLIAAFMPVYRSF